MAKKTFTIAQFAKKIGISRATIWRWTQRKDLELNFKKYDSQKIKIAGKVFIEQNI